VKEFEEGLRGILRNGCRGLLTDVATKLRSGSAPSPYVAVDALALSGVPEYGPFLVEMYLNAPLGRSPSVEYPNSIWEDVLLACSNLPRGQDLGDVSDYLIKPPKLSTACLDAMRRILEGHYENPPVVISALLLLQESASPEAIDIVQRSFLAKDEAIRDDSMRSLQNMPSAVAFPLLAQGLNDDSELVRFQAVQVISRWRNKEMVDLMRKRLSNESSERIRRSIQDYLDDSH
jgi:hypothetical protein